MQRSTSNRLSLDRRQRSRVRSDSVGPPGYSQYPSSVYTSGAAVSRSDKIRRGTYENRSYKTRVEPPEQLVSTTTGSDLPPSSLLPSFEHMPVQAYWNHITALQSQISKIEMQCAAINASLNAWKSFLNASEQLNAACDGMDTKFVMDDEEAASPDKKDVMPSNLPGALKSDLPPMQKRRSRAIVPPIAPHSRSQSRQQTYLAPWRQEEETAAQTQPELWPEVSDRKQTSGRKPVSSASPGKASEPLTGTSLTRWHLMQVKRLLDEPTGSSSAAQPPTGKSDPLLSPPPPSSGDVPRPGNGGPRAPSGLRRQQTTSIEFTVTQDESARVNKDRASARSAQMESGDFDKENAPMDAGSPRSETDASVFSGYFPTVTQHSSSHKPSCVPSLGLEPTRLPPSAWLSGQATQGDTYGA